MYPSQVLFWSMASNNADFSFKNLWKMISADVKANKNNNK